MKRMACLRSLFLGLLVPVLWLSAAGGAAGEEGDSAALRKRIMELEQLVEDLLKENADLRRQAEGTEEPAGKKAEPEPAPERKPLVKKPKAPVVKAEPEPAEEKKPLPQGARWISTTGKRHNSACRYYGKSEGRMAKQQDEGVACKFCGG